ncbi:MAG: STAS/SEC14 domain-containing protein [Granulosicoccus sp.]|nr:STAS/SEC14 domain-containing protein [Granulosicoccus sp.]
MFTINHPDINRIDIEIDGKIDEPTMRDALARLIESSSAIEDGKMLYRIRNFEMPTFAALMVELKRIPDLIRLVRRFDKVAVLADREWIRKAGEIEGAFIPGLTIKAFDLDEEDEAKAWLG